jgi:hypothetical protein
MTWVLITQGDMQLSPSTATACGGVTQPSFTCLQWAPAPAGSMVLGIGGAVGAAPPPAPISARDGMHGNALLLGTILPMNWGSGDVVGNVHHCAPPWSRSFQGVTCPSLPVWVLVVWNKHMLGGSCSSPTFFLSPYRFPCLVKLGGSQSVSAAGLPTASHPCLLGPALPLV